MRVGVGTETFAHHDGVESLAISASDLEAQFPVEVVGRLVVPDAR